ncbi:hypothetical protein APA_5217 [Pseudanabaena sp. lw0831]|nr:hypothetical protein APA_5217 [Pseudanabaena sp. lw0831]
MFVRYEFYDLIENQFFVARLRRATKNWFSILLLIPKLRFIRQINA